MSVLNIYIDDFIGIDPSTQTKGVTLQSVVAQITSYKEDYTTIKVNLIDTPGGDADMGFQIFDYLQKTGKEIHTHAVGLVASISSVIFMGGTKRTMDTGARLMIHNPYFSQVRYADADYLEFLAKDIRIMENKCESVYSKVTGISEQAISDLMKNETYIDSIEALKLGFTTEKESEQLKAVAFFNINNNEMNKGEKENLLQKIASLFEKDKPQALAMEVNAINGDVLVFEKEEGDPAVGDKANVNGEPATGEYMIADGEITYVFVNGELTEIKEKEDEAEVEPITEDVVASLIQKALEPVLASFKEQNDALKAEQLENTQILASIKGLVSDNVADTETKKESATEVKKENKLKLKFN